MGKVKKLTEDDFFKMSKTFQIWVKKKKDKSIEELSSSKSKKYFKKFIKKWNKSDLQSVYYDEEKLIEKYGECLTQKSKWQIKQEQQQQIQNQLREYQEALNGNSDNYDFKKDEIAHSKNLRKMIVEQEELDPDAPLRQKTRNEVEADREFSREQKREEEKYQKKKDNQGNKELLDEMFPKKIGKEGQIDKRRGINMKLNGQRDDDYEFNDDFLMGGGGDSYSGVQQMQRRKQENYQAKNYEIELKRNEYQQNEEKQIQSALDKNSYLHRFK